MFKSRSSFAEVPLKYKINCILSISNDIEKIQGNLLFQFAIQY